MIRGMRLAELTKDFRIDVYCECGRMAHLSQRDLLGTWPDNLMIGEIARHLRCQICGRRGPSIRVLYVGAGEYRHQGAEAISPADAGLNIRDSSIVSQTATNGIYSFIRMSFIVTVALEYIPVITISSSLKKSVVCQ